MKTLMPYLQLVMISVVVPLIMSKLKGFLGDKKWLIPLLAPLVAVLADTLTALGSQAGLTPGPQGVFLAAGAGLAGVGLREVFDQARKFSQEPPEAP